MIRSILAVVLLSGLATGAGAATILNDAPTNNNIQVDYFSPVGQSFTAIDSHLLLIGFKFGAINPSFPNDPIVLSLYAGTGTGGPLIAQSTQTVPGTIDYSFFTDFDFTGTNLTIGAVYSAALTVSGGSPFAGIGIQQTSTYAGGALFLQNDLLGCGASSCDASFRVIGESTNGVPEPASWALMITGFGLVGSALRRRRIAATA